MVYSQPSLEKQKTILEFWLSKIKAKLALSKAKVSAKKKRKEREQKGERKIRRKQEEIKKETRENQIQGYSKVLLACFHLSSYFEGMIMIPPSFNMMINVSIACYNKLW